MTVKDLISKLSSLDGDSLVVIFNNRIDGMKTVEHCQTKKLVMFKDSSGFMYGWTSESLAKDPPPSLDVVELW